MLSTLQLCRNKIQLPQQVTLGFHSNVIGDQHGYTAGHAWITIDAGSGVLYYYGLWPDGHPRVSNRQEKCTDVRIGLETGTRPAVSRYYRLNKAQVDALSRFINHPVAWRYNYNCSTWAVTLMQEVVGLDLDAVDYAFFTTPRELGTQLMKREKNEPTSPLFPHRGPPLEVQSSSWSPQ